MLCIEKSDMTQMKYHIDDDNRTINQDMWINNIARIRCQSGDNYLKLINKIK